MVEYGSISGEVSECEYVCAYTLKTLEYIDPDGNIIAMFDDDHLDVFNIKRMLTEEIRLNIC